MGEAIPMGLLPAHYAKRDPSRPAISIDETSLSWGNLEANANRRARMLQRAGVRQGDFVSFALPNSFSFYETTFAVWKLGATPHPMLPNAPHGEISRLLDLVRPRAIVGVSREIASGIPIVPAETTDDVSAESLPPIIASHWKAIGSGGSSGQPKVIVSSQPSVWDPEHTVLHMRAGETFLNPGPLYHNASFLLSHAALFVGSRVVDLVKFDAERALQMISAHRVNWVNLVPTMMHRIMRLPEQVRAAYDISSLRRVFHMAAPCPGWLKEAWINWLGPERIWELYGATEGVGGAMIGGDEWLTRRGSVGRVNAEAVAVFDGDGERCPANTIGEIFFKASSDPGYFYLGAEARDRAGWHSVGDLGRIDEDGYLYLVDRKGDLIISGGVNIYPAEVEAAIDALPGVCASAVIGLPDADLGERAHAIVQIESGAVLEVQSVLDFLASRLARYKLPRSVELTTSSLRNDAGKVRRSQLREERIETKIRG